MGSKLCSMTAFGRSSFSFQELAYTVEIRTANSRFLDVRVRTPWTLPEVERQALARIRDTLLRGRVEVNIRVSPALESASASGAAHVVRRFKAVKATLENVAFELNMEPKLELGHLLTAYNLLAHELPEGVDGDQLSKALLPALDQALESLVAMRKKEGEAMNRALAESLDAVSVLTESISSLAEAVPQNVKKKVEERISSLSAEKAPVDPVRLAQEVAILADKADVTEELARIQSHIDQIRNTRSAEAPHGRKLEFLLQEIQREVNTVGSKTPDVRISRAVVNLKTELEKMREIGQNVE